MKKKHHEEHDNSERWLLTYADLITLLLGLFVILYASSQVDAKKFVAVVQAFSRVFEGGSGLLPGTVSNLQGDEIPRPGEVKGEDDVSRQLKAAMESAMSKAIGEGRVTLSETSRGLTVHVAEKLLFDAGSDAVRQEATNVLDQLSKTLESLPNEVRIEGHTDDTPIRTAEFADNWHLSVKRALNVAEYLLAHSAIQPQRVGVVGYGEYRPIVPNDTEQNRARNRRVDIVVVK